jgi:hypothetical protein
MKKRVKKFSNEGYVTSDDSNSGMKEARDAIDEEIARTPKADYGDYMPESSSETVKATPVKPKMVTKEELAKSGLSLRAYMNKQLGLTARDEPKSKLDAIIAKGQAGNDAMRAEVEAQEAKPKLKYMSLQDRAKEYEEARAKSGVGMYGTKKANPRASEESRVLADPYIRKSEQRMMGSIKMASGGSVSSASRRADGIATKGKTRGKMC